MIKTALWLGLRFPPSISDNALENLINKADATDGQMRCIEAFLKPHGILPPFGLTYGKARQIIAEASETLNHYAIEALELKEGAIRQWEEEYYYILNIFGERAHHKIRIQAVQLHREPNATCATIRPKRQPRVINPHEMLYLSIPIDLRTWYPPNQQPLGTQYNEEPDF